MQQSEQPGGNPLGGHHQYSRNKGSLDFTPLEKQLQTIRENELLAFKHSPLIPNDVEQGGIQPFNNHF